MNWWRRGDPHQLHHRNKGVNCPVNPFSIQGIMIRIFQRTFNRHQSIRPVSLLYRDEKTEALPENTLHWVRTYSATSFLLPSSRLLKLLIKSSSSETAERIDQTDTQAVKADDRDKQKKINIGFLVAYMRDTDRQYHKETQQREE